MLVESSDCEWFLRFLGAVSRKNGTQLLSMLSEEYKYILSVAKSLIAMEARLTLMSAVVFKDWDG